MNDTTTETQPKAYSYSYAGNAGDRRRSQLAYLIAEQRRHDGQQVGTASGTPYGIVGGFAVEPIA